MGRDEATSVFAGDPLPVDVHHRGIWYPGEMLGWRFDGSGRCLARVRCVVDGLRHSTWKELTELRLPEPTAPPAVQAAAAAEAGRTGPADDLAPGVPTAAAATVPPAPAEPVAASSLPAVGRSSVGRHERAAPAWVPPGPARSVVPWQEGRDAGSGSRSGAPADVGRHREPDDRTLPHALLIDRGPRRRPPVPGASTPSPAPLHLG